MEENSAQKRWCAPLKVQRVDAMEQRMCVVAKDALWEFWIILEDVVLGRFRLLEKLLS
jgi:hypothetical protein